MTWEATHGVSKHPLYKRWNDMIQRCYNTKDHGYNSCGAKGIVVSAEWDRRNPKGAYNFIVWLEEELGNLPEGIDTERFTVARRKVDDPYSPSTCFITTNIIASQKRDVCVLSFDKVVELRKYKKDNPTVTLADICKQHGIKYVYTLSRCLKGISWPNVDVIEPPIRDLGGNCKAKA